MTSKPDIHLIPFLHPYMFVLRAGEGIKENMMDFSLSIWHLNCQERLPRQRKSKPVASVLNVKATVMRRVKT